MTLQQPAAVGLEASDAPAAKAIPGTLLQLTAYFLKLGTIGFGGLWWMQAVFYGVSAAVIGIIAIAASKLARKVNGRDPLLWGIFATLFVVTAVAQAELAEFFLVAGLLVLMVKAPPRWLRSRLPIFCLSPPILVPPLLAAAA